jgi:HK97 family phage portal protein
MGLMHRTRTFLAKAIAPRPISNWVDSGRWTRIDDPYPGAWQQDTELRPEAMARFSAVFACVRLISSDIAKLRPRIVKLDRGVWVEDPDARRPIIRRPNRFQVHTQFFRSWVSAKLCSGNAYVLLERDARGAVVAMYVLNSSHVEPMVTQDGGVYYRLRSNWLAGLTDEKEVYVPASEIIHDRGEPLYHPLLGTSPLSACAASASLGTKIASSASKLFENAARPSGIITAPNTIPQDVADRLAATWKERFSGANAGTVAVMGNGLAYQALTMSATDAQQIEQLRFSIEDVARAFGVPAHKIGAGAPPTFNNIAALNQSYYGETLQSLIEDIEALMDQALGFPADQGFEFDLDGLMRMDPTARADAAAKYVGAGVWSPNEARAREGLLPVEGGETPYLQQQNFSLAALANRPSPEASAEANAQREGKALMQRLRIKAYARQKSQAGSGTQGKPQLPAPRDAPKGNDGSHDD